MKTELTKEQSYQLIKLGVPKDKASKVFWKQLTDWKGDKIKDPKYQQGISDKPFIIQKVGFMSFSEEDVFTLIDLLKILPKQLYIPDFTYHLIIQEDDNNWNAYYTHYNKYTFAESNKDKELIDTLYKLLVQVIKEGLLKFN